MLNRREYVKIFAIILVVLLLIPTILVNAKESDSGNKLEGIGSSESSASFFQTQRTSNETIEEITDFSGGTPTNTELDNDGKIGLTWDLPKHPYESDTDTNQLNHFESSLIGNDDEAPPEYTRSTYGSVGVWDLDDGSGTQATDKSGKGNHGSLVSGPTWTTESISGKALSFDGVDDYVDCGNDVSLDVTTGMTAEGWIYLRSVTSWPTVMSKRDVFHITMWNNASWSMGIRTSGGNVEAFGGPITLNKWNYLVGTYDGSYARLYINGQLKGQVLVIGTILVNTNNLYMGPLWGLPASYEFDGILDEVAYYGRGKSPEEVKSDYESYLTNKVSYTSGKFSKGVKVDDECALGYPVGVIPEVNTMGFWRFNEGSGSTTKDGSGKGNDGTLANAPIWVSGITGKALSFDGVNDYVDCGNDISLDIPGYEITYQAWINHQFTPGSHTFANVLRKHWSGGSWIRFEANSEKISFNLYNVGSCSGTTTLMPNTWYHVACTYDGTQMAVYLNGKLDGLNPGASNPIASTAADNLYVGAGNAAGGEPWKGMIDELVIYNRTRTAEEIYNDYIARGQQNFNIKKGSIDMWIKPYWDGNDGENHSIFFSGNSIINDGFYIYKSSTNRLFFHTSDNLSESGNNPSVNVNNWKKNTWYHLAFTWDSKGDKEIYIDGELKASAGYNIMPNRTHSKFYIGTNPRNVLENLNGTIDEVRISSSVRSVDDFREYHPQGIYESEGFDAGEIVEWENIAWSSDTPVGTSLHLQTCTSDDNTTWTNWTGNIEGTIGGLIYKNSMGEPINAKQSRYIKWRAILTSDDGRFTAKLEKVNFTWNRLPRMFNVSITPTGPTVLDDIVIGYNYSDEDNDTQGVTKFEWYVDRGIGFIHSGYTNQTLNETLTGVGEEWFCRITPHDGRSYGLPVDSDTVIIKAGPLARIEVTPRNITITTSQDATFNAKAYDSEDNELPASFVWNVTGGGNIDQSGVFVPMEAGVHGVSASSGGISGHAVVTVRPGSLIKVNVFPINPRITADEMIQFEAVAFDIKDNPIPDVDVNWSVNGGGTIDPETGLFEAFETGLWTIMANVSGIIVPTKVTIVPGRLFEYSIETKNTTITTDDDLVIEVIGYDEDGNELPSNFNWEAENGKISPNGVYTPDEPGLWKVTVRGIDSDVFMDIAVTVRVGKPHEIKLTPEQFVMEVNESKQFSAIATDIKGNELNMDSLNFDWSVSDESLGYILDDGTFHAKKPGKVTITGSVTIPGNGNNSNTTRADSEVSGFAEVTIYEEAKPVTPPGEEEKSEALDLFEGSNLILVLLIIIFILIILVLIILLLRKPKREEPSRRREREEEEELEKEESVDEELEEWAPEEGEELPEEEEAPDEGEEVLEEEEAESWEVVDEEVEDEFEEEEPVVSEKKAVPKKGKMPIKGKMPKKDKLPEEDVDFDEDLVDMEILTPVSSGDRRLGKPQLLKAKESVKCNICLGFIKTGLNEIHCTCGKHYHEQCANRVGFCPVCDTDLTNIVDLAEMEGD